MNHDFVLLVLSGLTVSALFAAFIYAVGIVWRVELELDRSYKFTAWAALFFLLSEILDLIPLANLGSGGALAVSVTALLAAVLLFFGLYFMRDLVRRMDGEKKEK